MTDTITVPEGGYPILSPPLPLPTEQSEDERIVKGEWRSEVKACEQEQGKNHPGSRPLYISHPFHLIPTYRTLYLSQLFR